MLKTHGFREDDFFYFKGWLARMFCRRKPHALLNGIAHPCKYIFPEGLMLMPGMAAKGKLAFIELRAYRQGF
jgi:hypothetical protein